jgi:hypothetical protein
MLTTQELTAQIDEVCAALGALSVGDDNVFCRGTWFAPEAGHTVR